GFEIDTKEEVPPVAAVHFQPRRHPDLVQPFYESVGEPERARLHLDMAQRMPGTWPLSFFGLFRGRPGAPLRVCGYLDNAERRTCIESASHIAVTFDTIGFTAYNDMMLSQMATVMAVAPTTIDFQLDVHPDGVLAPATEGFVLVGPPADDGSSDTYVLKDGADTFETYERRSSENRVYSRAACTYRGRLFAIGSAWFEPNQRLFRATAMDVPEYPGDIPCEKDEPTPTPEPTPEPTPKPTPETKPSQAKALPKTDDPTISMPILVAIAVCRVAAIIIGVILRRNNRS
ncbi:MAG: hypothetical protein IKE22_07745, partial [Atopobiaceae bacterium]|nr:hypothetical protein [Atopobiaceae bacterium]